MSDKGLGGFLTFIAGLIVAFIVGLIAGVSAAWFYLQERIEAHMTRARELDASLDQKARRLQAWRTRAERAEARLQELEAAPSEPDDLKRIEGIGPKFSEVLGQAGITTFAQLAGTGVERLKQIIQKAGLRLADPTTWPEQAKWAAAGDWDGLERLQSELKGGRRA